MMKSELVQKIERLEADLTEAQETSLGSATLRQLSSALLDKISEAQAETEVESEKLTTKLGQLEDAYSAADKADDLVIEVESD